MFHEHELIGIIKKQNETIDKQSDTIKQQNDIILLLAKHIDDKEKMALKSQFIFDNIKIQGNKMTLTFTGAQNSVVGQLVPTLAGVDQPITAINAGSENYVSSDPTIATVASNGTPEGQYTVTRVAGASGNITVSYTATNLEGTTISGSDDYVFQAVIVSASADALRSDFQAIQ